MLTDDEAKLLKLPEIFVIWGRLVGNGMPSFLIYIYIYIYIYSIIEGDLSSIVRNY